MDGPVIVRTDGIPRAALSWGDRTQSVVRAAGQGQAEAGHVERGGAPGSLAAARPLDRLATVAPDAPEPCQLFGGASGYVRWVAGRAVVPSGSKQAGCLVLLPGGQREPAQDIVAGRSRAEQAQLVHHGLCLGDITGEQQALGGREQPVLAL